MSSQLLTVAEAADRLNVSHWTVRRHITAGGLSSVNVSTGAKPKIRVLETEIARFIADRTTNAKHLRHPA